MKAQGEVKILPHAYLILTLDRGEGLTQAPAFQTKEHFPTTHFI